MVWKLKREVLPLFVIVIFITFSIYAYSKLPDSIPSHFNGHGKPDQYMQKLNFMLIFFSLIIALYLVLTFIPLIYPFWKNIQPKYTLFLLLRDFVLLFFLYIYGLALSTGKKGYIETKFIGIGLGLLLVLIGNYLPKLPRNFFFGIRTPWTIGIRGNMEEDPLLWWLGICFRRDFINNSFFYPVQNRSYHLDNTYPPSSSYIILSSPLFKD